MKRLLGVMIVAVAFSQFSLFAADDAPKTEFFGGLSILSGKAVDRVQAYGWQGAVTGVRVGVSVAHLGMASGQRVWNVQPLGRLAAEGTSPVSTIRFRLPAGAVTGTAESSAWV